MAAPKLYPLNDFALLVTLKTVNASGQVVPLEDATCTTFLSTGNLPTSTATSGLTGTVTYTNVPGKYLVEFSAATLTASALSSAFASTPPYLIVQQANGIRGYLELEYVASRPIEAA